MNDLQILMDMLRKTNTPRNYVSDRHVRKELWKAFPRMAGYLYVENTMPEVGHDTSYSIWIFDEHGTLMAQGAYE